MSKPVTTAIKSRPELALFEALGYFSEARTCVEIGVAYGDGTYHLCKGVGKNGGHVYGFDIWSRHGLKGQFRQFSSKEDVENKLKTNGISNFTLTQIDSINNRKALETELDRLCPNGIDLAFIDGDHSYVGIANDFAIVYPRLTERGMVAFHDTLIIDGCREFVLDLRTKYNDGTFDVVDFSAGKQKGTRVGITLLVKRSYPVLDTPIIEICGSPSTPEVIEQKEVDWLASEVASAKPEPIQLDGDMHLDTIGSYDRKKFERI